MKTMTCQQLGGPCDLAHRGETHDDVINAQDQHLKEAEKAGDAAHQPSDFFGCRQRLFISSRAGWYRDMKQAFADLPED